MTALARKILEYLHNRRVPARAAEIAEDLGLDLQLVKETIWELTVSGRAEITEDWKLKWQHQ